MSIMGVLYFFKSKTIVFNFYNFCKATQNIVHKLIITHKKIPKFISLSINSTQINIVKSKFNTDILYVT